MSPTHPPTRSLLSQHVCSCSPLAANTLTSLTAPISPVLSSIFPGPFCYYRYAPKCSLNPLTSSISAPNTHAVQWQPVIPITDAPGPPPPSTSQIRESTNRTSSFPPVPFFLLAPPTPHLPSTLHWLEFRPPQAPPRPSSSQLSSTSDLGPPPYVLPLNIFLMLSANGPHYQ